MADTNEIKEMTDVIHNELFNFRKARCEQLAEKLHEADFRKVVRCKDCVYKMVTSDGEYDPEDIGCSYHMSDGFDANDFCSYGEEEQNNDS